ncbi:MAG: PilW family protein [Candidatus Binatia bacterium]
MYSQAKRLAHKLKSCQGFTIGELLLAALFGLIIMATLYGFYRDQLFDLLAQETKTATLEDARGALDIMVRELRNAGSWGTGTAPAGCFRVVGATPTLIQVQADLDGNGDCSSATGEDVTYDLSSSTSTCPGSIIRRNGVCLIANVVTPTGSLFTYYDSTGTLLAGSPPVNSIKRVQITFAVQVSNPNPNVGGNVTSTLSSSVAFRN